MKLFKQITNQLKRIGSGETLTGQKKIVQKKTIYNKKDKKTPKIYSSFYYFFSLLSSVFWFVSSNNLALNFYVRRQIGYYFSLSI